MVARRGHSKASAKGKAVISRLIPYWLISLSAFWIVAFIYIWSFERAYEFYKARFVDKLYKNFENEIILRYDARLVGFIVPLLVAASVTAFLVTDTKLPVWPFTWVNKVFSYVRRFKAEDADYGRQLSKKNQFALGEQNFNMLAIWFVVLPSLVYGFGTLPLDIIDEMVEDNGASNTRERWKSSSYNFALASVVSMTFFLIPVARHSVLVTAMGWNPIQALRIHIWAGYLSFLYAALHAITIFVVFLGYDKLPLYQQFVPRAECWGRDANFTEPEDFDFPIPEDCEWQWVNLTGATAMLWFVILWATSLNWVRRKNYRLFYICHVLFGSLMLLSTFLHFDYTGIYMLPSTVYYIASTAPALVQALASRFRGGNNIVRVLALQDGGGCMELHVAADAESSALLKKEPGLYVKLCVPKISLIWHPFTVYRHQSDKNVLRVLFRPIGPFTKSLAMNLMAPERPVTIVDGFYHGSDRISHALHHDQVTIIAGGVAITPFLTFIPSLINAVGEHAKEDRILNALTFHWAVREHGLKNYLTKEFLRGMVFKANEINFDFQVKIYQTGSKAKTLKGSSVERAQDDTANNDETITDETSSGSDSAELALEENKVIVAPIATTPGFEVEVARTMPARFSDMRHNIPYAAGFVCFMWLSFHLIFSQYNRDNDHRFSGRTGIAGYTLVVLALAIVYGAAVECAELLYRKYFPAPKLDSFILEERQVADMAEVANCEFDLAKMETRNGRPTVEQLMVGAKAASAPGIFLCGPAALCDVVWTEVRKENSFLGRTRYCMYDEPFEM